MSAKALAKNAAVIIATLVVVNQVGKNVSALDPVRRLAGLS